MLVRLVFLVAASVAAYAVKQVSLGRQKELKPPEGSHEARYEKNEHEDNDKDGNTQLEDKEEEIEQVKRISTVISPNSRSPTGVDDDEMGLPEFEELLSSVMDLPSPKDKFDVRETHQPGEYQRVYGREMENHAMEMERLQNLVKELEEREVKLEGELLEYYGLKEQEVNIAELQKQLKIKMVEIDMLNVSISTLQTEKKKLEEEIERGSSSKKELEAARKKIKELQRQMQLDANQTKGHLLMLKQQVTSLKSKEEDTTKRDVELERKLRVLKDVDVEMAELKRKNRELQHEKREISMRLDAAEAKVAILENMTETDMVAKVRDEVNGLMHANEDLLKQVEGLQTNRFSEVEELVYLRWVNACLRYELRNFQAPVGKASARDLNKSLSPKSQERAKRLLLDYAVSDVASQQGQGDTDLESISSLPSSPGSEDFDTVSIDSFSSRYSSSKKPSLLQKLKRWGKSKDDSSVSSPSRSFGESSPRPSIGHRVSSSKGPLEALMMRNSGETVAITTYGRKENDHDDLVSSPDLPSIRTTVPSGEPLNNVAASFHLMSKSVDGVLDDKYPAYKDRHKLSLAREKAIRDKADQARAERFGDNSKVESKPKLEKPTNGSPSPITHKERVRSDAKGDIAVDDSNEKPNDENRIDSLVVNKIKLANIEKKAPRVARPPPRPSSASSGSKTSAATVVSGGGPPPPPPPPGAPPPPPPLPGSISRGAAGSDKVHRAPELVELYQSLMKREAKKDTSSLSLGGSNSGDARNNMIGEIEGRSAFLIAVKADVETQGDFVQTLASEVRAASFTNVDDLVSFVNWLDEELSFLVDERAVLKHFDWPEGKADALREASFEYQDLMKLEKQMSCFVDDSKLPCEAALKKMYSLLEKVEQSVYALLRTRDMAISRYKEFGLPYDWMLDSGVVGKIKLASVQLARKYMKRVATELDSLGGPEKEPTREFLVLQGVRFAFRVHQFAGGFDAESMKAFEELRSRVHSQKSEAVDTSSTA